MVWNQWTVSVLSGLTVAALVALTRYLWVRRRVPTVLSRSTRRRDYLLAIQALSKQPELKRLDVLTPRLYAANGSELIADIQDAWAGVNDRDDGEVRVLTAENERCRIAGAELVAKGIEVRVTPLRSDILSYHLFQSDKKVTAVINLPDRGRNRPVRLDGLALARVFESHFESLWAGDSRSLESKLADMAIEDAGPAASVDNVVRAMERSRSQHNLNDECYRKVLTHLAFLHSASVIFVVGLPGAGKSLVRHRLARQLNDIGLKTEEFTDYVYAYRDFIHDTIKLDPQPHRRFEPESGGAFRVSHEADLNPALHALAEPVWANKGKGVITLVEFARSNILTALQVFGDEVRARSQVVYVQASDARRQERLQARAQPPIIKVGEEVISVVVSDNHRLPSVAAAELYVSDDVERLLLDRHWRSRIFQLGNDFDGRERVDEPLKNFSNKVVHPYASRQRPRRPAPDDVDHRR
jgi:AAA domain